MFDDSKMVFIIGFPRSGTTWIQNEFSKLSNTFTPTNETFFLTSYFNRLFHAWKLDTEDTSVNGISKLLTEHEYIEWL
ncbi:MAG: sulfotransferase, partial [Candidatus Poseidoniaceae archaeon]